jgi:hypothetical protein
VRLRVRGTVDAHSLELTVSGSHSSARLAPGIVSE